MKGARGLVGHESNKIMVASIQASHRSTKRRAKAQFDSIWHATTIREASEQL